MNHGFIRAIFLILAGGTLLVGVQGISRQPKVLLISFDGFRHDLLNQTMTPHIYKWAMENTWFTSGSRSQYITFTAPNHMSIVTGLYEENHGIVSNFFYDMATNKSTQMAGVVNASLQSVWYRGEPIWITNERGGSNRLSSTYFWPMGEANFPTTPAQGHYHKAWTTYGDLATWMADCDEVIDEFTREDAPVNFVAWYIAEPDHTLHTNGFYNGALKKKVTDLDQLFQYFLGKLADRGLEKEINVILTADHGHAEILDQKHIMCIKDFLPEGDFFVGDHMIYPRDDVHAMEIYTKLTNAVKTHNFDIKIHLKTDFPQRYHYHNSSRIGAVIMEPAVGSAISFSCHSQELERDYGVEGTFKFNSSTHGMDPDRPEMRAMLVMAGPLIATKTQIQEIPNNIDLYPLMCHLLNITPAANNGTLDIVKKSLRSVGEIFSRKMEQNVITDSFGFLFFFAPAFCIVVLYIAYAFRHTIIKNDPTWGLKTDGYRPLDPELGEEENGIEFSRLTASQPRNGGRRGEISMSSLLHDDNSSIESL